MSGHDPSSDPDFETDQQACLRLLVAEQSAFLMGLDWGDPDRLALAERRGRIIGTHRTNVEKTVTGSEERGPSYTPEDTERLRRELERRLVEHSARLGKAEVARRIRARGLDPADAGLVGLGAPGPDGA